MDTQQCATCHKELPMSSFAKNKTKKTGYNYKCNTCQKEYIQANTHEPSTQPQCCKTCSQVLPSDQFYKNSHNTNGLSYVCKGCTPKSSSDAARKKRVARNKTLIRRYKLSCGCVRCGHRGHESGIELDIVKPDMTMGSKPTWGRKKLKEEIRKSAVLCNNCQRAKTYELKGNPNDD